MDRNEKPFNFQIALSVLNLLGRNLYRNFITILGEAISNSWDADAKNVWIEIDLENSCLTIIDDGIGMNRDDFQNKFLKVGYSKRKDGESNSPLRRPYIGAKGIGKLALLSCAKRVTVISKTNDSEIIGGLIDNSGLDNAIKDDLTTNDYPLEDWDESLLSNEPFMKGHGTLIYFDGLDSVIKNRVDYIKELIALSFRFSVSGLKQNDNFDIYVNGEIVSVRDLQKLIQNTQYWWAINEFSDEYTRQLNERQKSLNSILNIRGFLATVYKPSHTNILGTGEKVTVDLFVNGRLREKNILRHDPTHKIIESYLYGQIHFDEIDPGDEIDPFTTSREGVLENNEKFDELMIELRKNILPKIISEWDSLRVEKGEEGDPENTDEISTLERNGRAFAIESGKLYKLDKDDPNKDKVDAWIEELVKDAYFNYSSYIHCFLSENLCRKYLEENGILSISGINISHPKSDDRLGKKRFGFEIRKNKDDIYYYTMRNLVKGIKNFIRSQFTKPIKNNFDDYHPLRNVVCHTGILTDQAKERLKDTLKQLIVNVKSFLSGK